MIKLYPEPINQLCEQIYFSGIIKARIKIFNRDYDSPNDCNTDLFPDDDEDDVQEGNF